MAHIFKVQTTKPLPADAELVTKNGARFVRLKRNGRAALFPLTPCGTRFSQESRKWYVQYRDAQGRWQRVAGFVDKEATAQLAAELQRKAERLQSGLGDPYEEGKTELLAKHLAVFRRFLESKANTAKHVDHTCRRIEQILDGCKFLAWTDLSPSRVLDWLAAQRAAGEFGVKTSNYYLAAIKEFCQWLVKDGRVDANPLAHLPALNAATDVRRRRRALTDAEFAALVAAAETGPSIQGVAGVDRAMLYILAAWTGYRRNELASLTRRSFNFAAASPTVSVAASYSKRRRHDVVPLHPVVAERLQAWLARRPAGDGPVFPLTTPRGVLRRTSKMMELDLERARQAWLAATSDPQEQKRRSESDFLKYQSEAGLYADFHANRHTFISNLAKAGVTPKLAQSIARHSDVNLTLSVYSHVGLDEQAAAIGALPEPPRAAFEIPETKVGAKKFAHRFAQTSDPRGHGASLPGREASVEQEGGGQRNPLPHKQIVIVCRPLTLDDSSSGGGIRTPDTRIMIPAGDLANMLPDGDLDQLGGDVCTYVCTEATNDEALAQIVTGWRGVPDVVRSVIANLIQSSAESTLT